MFIFRHGSRCASPPSFCRSISTTKRALASKIDIPFAPPPFPVVDACPVPTCPCRESPSGLEIEREQNLNGSMAAYAEQVLISTGRSDWSSRIEEGDDAVLVKHLKGFLGRGGKYSDPYHNIMLTNSSIPATRPSPNQPSSDPRSASAYLLPSFCYLPTISTDSSSVESLVKAFLLPSQLHQSQDRLTRAQRETLQRQPALRRQFAGARRISEILVLICGHGNRDARCGTLGPILQAEFEEKLERQNVEVLRDAPAAPGPVDGDAEVEGSSLTARVALISHIGGHKWAGNVIVYVPPAFKSNALAGKGIWYGRVAPGHVEGIVETTLLQGKVVRELFRGGIDQSGDILRL